MFVQTFARTGGHFSGRGVAAALKRPTRGLPAFETKNAIGADRSCPPIWACSGPGLPCLRTFAAGAVGSYPAVSPLPGETRKAFFSLSKNPLRAPPGGLFSVALSLKSGLVRSLPPMGVAHGPVLRRPDFPRRIFHQSAAAARHPAHLQNSIEEGLAHCIFFMLLSPGAHDSYGGWLFVH